ncbi:response regulator [Aestuariibius sp. HNIBRBA575]|uniref:response regulator n=1 Tax=Aestuariibius sp. HNIBRBA575 TaxID=3233343 RepID=UPI0034A25CFA
MNVLIVESKAHLAQIWRAHLQRYGAEVDLVYDGDLALECLAEKAYEAIVLDLFLDNGSAMAVADYAQYRHPDSKIIFVTDTTFFSDGSIFRHIPNAAGFLRTQTPPEDLAAIVDHHGRAA